MNKARRPTPLRQRLLVIAAAGIVPLALGAGIGLVIIGYHQWHEMQMRGLEVARMSAASVEIEVDNSLARLNSLALSPLLDRHDMAAFRLLMERVLEVTPSWHSVTLATVDREPLVHLVEPERAFQSGAQGIESFSTVVQTHQPVVGYLARDPAGRWAVPLRVPVLRNGELRYVLSAMLKPEAVSKVLSTQGLLSDWTVVVFDARLQRLARSWDHDQYIGVPATPSLVKLFDRQRDEGSGIAYSHSGVQLSATYVRLKPYDWVVGVGRPTTKLRESVVRDFKIYAIGLAASLLLSLMAAWLAARSIAGPMRGLRRAAEQLGRGETPDQPDTRIHEIREVGQALVMSAQLQRATEAQRRNALTKLVVAQDDLRQQLDDLQRVHRLSNQLLQMGSVQDQMQAVLAALCELHGADKGLVMLPENLDGAQQAQVWIGLSPSARDALQSKDIMQRAMGSSQRLIVSDIHADDVDADLRDIGEREGFCALHATSMRGGTGRNLGVMTVYLRHPHVPTEREIRLSDLYSQLCALFLERTLAEAGAHRSEQRLQIALDSASVAFGVLVPSRDDRFVITDFVWEYVNRAAASMLGKPPEAVTGRGMRDVAAEIWTAPGLFQACVDVVQNDRGQDWELDYPYEDDRRWLQMVITPFNGKIAVWWSDVTQRKVQEQMLHAADKRKDEFIAILAHELRNPLAPIQQATTIARSPTATETQKRWSHDVIERQVRHMALLLDDLLDVSRITRRKLELKKTVLDLRTAIDTAVETARPHFQVRNHHLQLDVPLQPIVVQADPIRVSQIVTNLLTNAARYTNPGGDIRLVVRVDANEAVVEVSDNGIGIPAEHLDSIFEMFSQVRSKRSTPDSGLGIGLALARGVAALHGGTLVAASEGPGRGSRFTLRLPLNADQLPAVAPPLRAPPPPAGLCVVVADDNRDAADTLSDFLRLEGHTVGVAYDGEQALQQYEALRPDVMLLDIGMPKLDGYEVARRIRARSGETDSAPMLIALTGWGQASDKAEAEAAGFDRHLTKPVNPDELLQMLPTQPL